jgi:hypothetical protein
MKRLFKDLLMGVLVIMLLGIFSMPIAAAEKARTNAGLQGEKNAILHAVAKACSPKLQCKPGTPNIVDGLYATVLFKCTRKDKQCENDIAYLMKVGGAWIIKEQGTGISQDDLIKDGFPPHIAKKICGW